MSRLGKIPIKTVLIDIHGVLYESGTTSPIPGSIEAINKLRSSGLKFKFVTNETQNTCSGITKKLIGFGFNVNEAEIFAPAPAVRRYLMDNQLRPHFLVHPREFSSVTLNFIDDDLSALVVEPEFEGIDTSQPNCVVLGDAGELFSYDNLNRVFNCLLKQTPPILITMGGGRFYQEKGQLVIDVGAYAKGLEYAADCEATIIGRS